MRNVLCIALLLPACVPDGELDGDRRALISYEVRPSDTDGDPTGQDCPDTGDAPGIGCENRWTGPLGEMALNGRHFFSLPASSKTSGKLLLFLCGGSGNAAFCENIFPVAARQGYHVIGLTYAAGHTNDCNGESLDCYGNFLSETVFGKSCAGVGCEFTNVGEHEQDSLLNRLVKALQWADDNHPYHGWNRYLSGGAVNWSRVHLAGFSGGTSHASFIAVQPEPEFRGIGRVAMLASPNDGAGGKTEETWTPATYIKRVPGVSDRHFYGMVHELNKAKSEDPEDSKLHQTTKAWLTFGMEEPFHRHRIEFDPELNKTTEDFDGAHMLISTDKLTTAEDAHNSVARGQYCTKYDPDGGCETYGDLIGYEPAWRCILGTGGADFSAKPIADAGPDQIVECAGGGGANVVLDGSKSKDADCDVLDYAWSGPFGVASGRTPTVFLSLGTNTVTLSVSDPWWDSESPDTTTIKVQDTTPPSLQVRLAPSSLWPPNHKMVRIEATVSVSDVCGDAAPKVVLTSIVSDQPDNGIGDGDTDGDVQEADFGTLDTSFLVRGERAGVDASGRSYTVTYTATDASGNQTQTSATVHVSHSGG